MMQIDSSCISIVLSEEHMHFVFDSRLLIIALEDGSH